MKDKLKIVRILLVAIIITIATFSMGFYANQKVEPELLHRVYIEGKHIGTIRDKQELDNYINEQELGIKEKYKTDKVYPPIGLEVVKELTYHEDIVDAKDIYRSIQKLRPFTIEGYEIKIEGKEEVIIYVLEKALFINAAEKTIKAFVDNVEYDNFFNDNQDEIVEFGKLIEDIYIEEDRTIKKTHIPTDELIFTDENELAKYLLFGTLEEQEKYEVKTGDTIETVAFDNNLSVDEFLVANPQFTDAKNLLYPGQIVNIGLINPRFSVVVEEHIVEEQVKEYITELREDPTILVGNSYELRSGVDGREKVSQKIKKVNGKIENLVPISREELEPAINRIYVQGGRVVKSIADMGFWAWPTNTPYTITSGYGPRWGSFHAAIDIAGTGYGSPIYAANNGTVHRVEYDHIGGNFIIINHNNSYYTYYGHLATAKVRVGQVVQRGTIIGTMGNTGYNPITGKRVGTHLHYGVAIGEPYRGGHYINPYTVYRK